MKLRIKWAVAFATAVAILTAATVTAHDGYAPLHYSGPCDTGSSSYNQKRYIDPFVHQQPGVYDHVAATVTIRNLFQCSSPSADDYGFSVVAISLQNEPLFLLQMGFGVCVQKTCQHGFPSTINKEAFWYTKHSNGDLWAATWVDFDNDGVPDSPVQGRSYTFSITIGLSGTWGHTYWIKDNYTGLTDSTFVAFPNTAGAMYPWWGFERQNGASALGSTTSGSNIDLRLMKYSTFSTGAFTLSGTGYTCHSSVATTYTPCSVTVDTGGYTVVKASTDQH